MVKEEYEESSNINEFEEIYDEEKIVDSLQYFPDEYTMVQVVKKFKDEKLKLKALKFMKNYYRKLDIIKSIKDDEIKIELLQNLEDDLFKAYVIETISDVKKRINLATKLSNIGKKKYISLINDDKERIGFLKNISDEDIKERVVKRIIDDSLRIEALKYLKDEFAKSRIICTLQDDKQIIYGLKYLQNDFAKIVAIMYIKDAHLKIRALNNLKDDLAKAFVKQLIYGKYNEISLTDRSTLKTYCLIKETKYSQIGLDKNITIGVEIESEGEISKYIYELEEVLTGFLDGEKREWKTKKEDSLEKGVEVVSPILTDKKEDVEDIYMVCSFLTKCGQNISQRCGGHIHIGADYLKGKEAYINLLEIFGNTEKIICIISNEKGSIPRMSMKMYATPLSPKLNEAIEKGTINLESEEDLNKFINDIQSIQEENRYYGLNLLNINNGKNTIEFRVPNGTLNPDVWIENARIFGRIVQISQKLAEIEKQTEKSVEDEKILQLKERLKEEMPEKEKLEILLELLFTEDEKVVYKERYDVNSKMIENLPSIENPFYHTTFSSVDFKKKHSKNEFEEIAVTEKEKSTINTIRETKQGVRIETQVEQINYNDL